MAADLHVHTTFSDGDETPEEVVNKAKEAGLKTIAITDHDVVDGIKPAEIQGEKVGVNVIPGVEFTTELPNAEIHILGYHIDSNNKSLKDFLLKVQESRRKRIHKITDKLQKLGVDVSAEKVFEFAGGASAGRPHVARALMDMGVVKSIREAFSKYLEWKGPAYVSHYKLSPEGAIKLILDVGGVPVFAHPATSGCDEIIPDLLAAGLKGIEVYYPGMAPNAIEYYLNLAEKLDLVVTGGTDYHGSGKKISLGDINISDELVDKLAEAKGS
jgi:predicted metal-dependent phosphoesterase TrpH